MKSSAAAAVVLLPAPINRHLAAREPAPGVADLRAGLAPATVIAASGWPEMERMRITPQ